MPSINVVKQQAWKLYNQWRKETIYSPALASNVRISLKGWWHIAGHMSGNVRAKKRTAGDTYRRLMLLPYAKEILQKATTIQNIVTRRGTNYYAIEAVVMVQEDGKSLPRKVRVIVIEDKAGNKSFYSIFDKRQRSLARAKVSTKMKKALGGIKNP